MPILMGLEVLIQFCFAFHVLKTGRPYWWIFIIMSFPVMGCVIYYFVEVFPGSREHRRADKTVRKIVKAMQPDADLKKRAEELEICGSVDNRIALAEECINHQMYAEAVQLYESCLTGAFASDATLLYGLARASVEHRAWDKANKAIAQLKAAAPKSRTQEVRLLEARVSEGLGENDRALTVYQELIPVFVGLEARYRYASFLAQLGKNESALEVFNEIVKNSKRFASSLEDEQHWAEAARKAVLAAGGR